MEKQNRSRSKLTKIALIGYRATGKTTVGKKLAKTLQYDFMDMDTEISKGQNLSIEKIVEKHGWNYFRNLETELLKTLITADKLVVSTGGGIILDRYNRRTLKKHFSVIWLQASPELIKNRLKSDLANQDHRPPLSNKNILEEVDTILNRRLKYYAETADFTISTENLSPEELVETIIKHLKQEGLHA